MIKNDFKNLTTTSHEMQKDIYDNNKISNEIYNQDAFFKGLDFSYSYEDQFEFTCKELLNYT